MKESTTYQAILREGLQQGRQKGRQEGLAEGAVTEARKLLLRLGSKKLGRPSARTQAVLAKIADLVVSGKIMVNVEMVLPLKEARKAQELSQKGHAGGKIVLRVADGR